MEWILRVQVNGGRKIKQNQAEFIDMSPLCRNYRFNYGSLHNWKGYQTFG